MHITIDPELKELLPPLDDEEFQLLEDNILKTGLIKTPLTVWNGTIVDGHNRWAIIQKHPEIPYEIDEVDFSCKDDAILWIYQNQFGRRNLSDVMRSYVRGQLYELEKRTQGGTGANQYTFEQSGHNAHSAAFKKKAGDKTAERIGEKYGVNARTIRRDAEYAIAVDMADSLVPGFKNALLSGSFKVPKKLLKSVCELQDGLITEALESIKRGDICDAKALVRAGASVKKKSFALSMADIKDVEFKVLKMNSDDLSVTKQIAYLQDAMKQFSTVLAPFVNEPALSQNISDENKMGITEQGNEIIQRIENLLQTLA